MEWDGTIRRSKMHEACLKGVPSWKAISTRFVVRCSVIVLTTDGGGIQS